MKKKDPFDKDNYRAIIILPLVSKVFEKNTYSQVCSHMQQDLNPLLSGFQQGHWRQYALFQLPQAW